MDYRNIPRFDCQKQRSTLQAETPDIPVCQGHVDGIHCGHLDTHDSCCDCNLEVGEDGALLSDGTAF